MIFIKNFTKNKKTDKIEIQSERNGDESSISFWLPGDVPVNIVKSSIPLLSTSIRRSIEHIGKLTNSLNKTDTVVSANILDDDGATTEVAVYTKDTKVALVYGEGDEIIPIKVEVAPEDTGEDKKRFPRDMVLIIVDKADTRLVVDNRNLATPPLIATAGEYQIIFAMIKWPIWSNLKFPVYMYVVQNGVEIGAVQLSSRTDNKITKNCVNDVEISEAKEYLNESEKIRAQKREQKESLQDRQYTNKRNNAGNNRSNDKYGNGKRQQNSGNQSVKFPQKFSGSGVGKNYHKNGNR